MFCPALNQTSKQNLVEKAEESKPTECVKDLFWTLVKEVKLLFLGHFWPLLKVSNIFLIAVTVAKIASSL